MAIAFVQGNSNGGFSGSDPLPVALTGVGAGNAIVGIACCDDAGAGTFVGVSDTSGNTYTIVDQAANNGVRRAITFVAGNVASGSPTINVDLDTTHGNWTICVAEYSGTLASTNPIDNSGASHVAQIQAAPTTGTDAATSTAVTTVTNGCQIIGLTANTNGASLIASSGTGFSALRTSDTKGSAIEDKAQGSAGSVAATFTLSSNVSNFTAMMALQPAAAGGGARKNQMATLGVG